MVESRKVKKTRLRLSCWSEQPCFWSRWHLIDPVASGCLLLERNLEQNSMVDWYMPVQPDMIQLQHSPADVGTLFSTIFTESQAQYSTSIQGIFPPRKFTEPPSGPSPPSPSATMSSPCDDIIPEGAVLPFPGNTIITRLPRDTRAAWLSPSALPENPDQSTQSAHWLAASPELAHDALRRCPRPRQGRPRPLATRPAYRHTLRAMHRTPGKEARGI